MSVLLFFAAIFLRIVHVYGTDQGTFAARYLERYGYLSSRNDSEVDDGLLTSGIKLYQRTYGLRVTGRLDNSTMGLMMRPRCGVADLGMRRSRTRGTVVADDGARQSDFEVFEGELKWTKRDLMYRYEVNEELPRGIDYEAAILRAFMRWEGVCRYFNFRQLADQDIPSPPESSSGGDILIGWYSGDHGDGFAFDGRGGTAAHAFPLPSGQMHFDADEIWYNDEGNDDEAVARGDQVDLESVAVHEIGHVLGLAHTDVKGAVMYPVLGYGEVKRDLNTDDIEAIRALYPSCNIVERKG